MTTIEREAFFRCIPSGCTFFVCGGEKMKRYILKNVIDPSGVILTPGKPDVCLGNGEQGFECCCDECDFFLLCFPEFDPENKSGFDFEYD